jgi:hypothetical protein
MTAIPAGTKFVGLSASTPIVERKSAQNNAAQAIYTIEDISGAQYTETIVNISSAQILAMGSTPIELLPVAGANAYYDIDKVIIENVFNTTGYTITNDEVVLQINSNARFLRQILGGSNAWFVIRDLNGTEGVVSASVGADITPAYGEGLNKGLTINTYNATDPTLGDGTLRVKIYHKTITFGA